MRTGLAFLLAAGLVFAALMVGAHWHERVSSVQKAPAPATAGAPYVDIAQSADPIMRVTFSLNGRRYARVCSLSEADVSQLEAQGCRFRVTFEDSWSAATRRADDWYEAQLTQQWIGDALSSGEGPGIIVTVTSISCSEALGDPTLDALADQVRGCAHDALHYAHSGRFFGIERSATYGQAEIEAAPPTPEA